MPKTWYDECYRKLFFDFHSAGTAVGLAAAFDAEAWADRLVAANAQAVSVFTKCGYGYSFYQKGSVRYQHPHLPAGLDMLGEQIEALHRRGLKAIGYYHTFNSEPIARDHPDWIERNADGTPRGISICLLSPLATQWMLPHVAEIVSNYDVDSMFFDGTFAHSVCYCDGCRERFAAECGLALPKDNQDPSWGPYVAWKLQALKDLRHAICDTIHHLRPEVVVSINWAYTPRMPEVVPAEIGALVADIPPDDQVFAGSYLASCWELLEKPFDIMNSAFLQWWGDWGCKPAIAMQQEVATAIAHGGLTWIGYQMQQDYDVQPAAMGELGQALAFIRDREDLLVGSEAVPNVAVLHSLHNHFTGDPVFFVRETSARGAHRMLAQSMIPHHLVNEETLLRRLGEFRAVVLPDQRYLEPALVAALKPWVESGGILVAMAATGTLSLDTESAGVAPFAPGPADAVSGCAEPHYEDTGAFALQDLLGVALSQPYDQSHAYIEVTDDRLKPGTLDMPHLAEAPFMFVDLVAPDLAVLARLRRAYLREDGQYLLRWSPVGDDSGHPAITLRQVGKGYAIYCAGDICHAYQVKNQWNLKYLLANLLRLTMPEPPVTVAAPAWLEVVLRRQPARRLLVHLLNQHGDHAVDTNFRTVEAILPVRDVQVRVRCPQRPSAITLEPGGSQPAWTYADGVASITVPEVHIHQTVALQF